MTRARIMGKTVTIDENRVRGSMVGHARRVKVPSLMPSTSSVEGSLQRRGRSQVGSNPAPSPSLAFVRCFGEPMGKPRMTRSDKWKQRKCVVRYRQWADSLREAAGLTEKYTLMLGCQMLIHAYFPIPNSWSRAAKEKMKGKPHLQKPDWDNVAKAVADALIANDHMIWSGLTTKYWDDGNGPRVEVWINWEVE